MMTVGAKSVKEKAKGAWDFCFLPFTFYLFLCSGLFGERLDHGFLDGDDNAVGDFDVNGVVGNFVDFAVDAAADADTVAFFEVFAELTFFFGLFLLGTHHEEPHDYEDEDEPDEHAAATGGALGLEKDGKLNHRIDV